MLLSLNVPVALKFCVPPTPIEGLAGTTVIETRVGVTVNVVGPQIGPVHALNVTEPAATPNTAP